MDSNIIITNSDAQYTFSSNLRLGIYEWFGLEKWKVHDLVSPQSRGKFPSLPPLLLRPKSAARRLQCSMNSNEIPGNHCETTMSSPPLKPLGPQVDPQHADPTFRQQLEETSDIGHVADAVQLQRLGDVSWFEYYEISWSMRMVFSECHVFMFKMFAMCWWFVEICVNTESYFIKYHIPSYQALHQCWRYGCVWHCLVLSSSSSSWYIDAYKHVMYCIWTSKNAISSCGTRWCQKEFTEGDGHGSKTW